MCVKRIQGQYILLLCTNFQKSPQLSRNNFALQNICEFVPWYIANCAPVSEFFLNLPIKRYLDFIGFVDIFACQNIGR